jgi:hypothetical protein
MAKQHKYMSWMVEKKNNEQVKLEKEFNQSAEFVSIYVDQQKIRKKTFSGKDLKVTLKITLPPDTLKRTMQIVEFGKGKYTSSYINVAVLLLNELITDGEDLDRIAQIILDMTLQPTYLFNNITRLKSILVPKEETF